MAYVKFKFNSVLSKLFMHTALESLKWVQSPPVPCGQCEASCGPLLPDDERQLL